jgi:hypothetical protein
MNTLLPLTSLRGRIRLKRRRAMDTPLDLSLPVRKRTLLDRRLSGDPWVEDLGCGLLALCLDENCLACIRGVELDLHFFNRLVDRLWHRPPSPRRVMAQSGSSLA